MLIFLKGMFSDGSTMHLYSSSQPVGRDPFWGVVAYQISDIYIKICKSSKIKSYEVAELIVKVSD